jgi:hypothetical protein
MNYRDYLLKYKDQMEEAGYEFDRYGQVKAAGSCLWGKRAEEKNPFPWSNLYFRHKQGA